MTDVFNEQPGDVSNNTPAANVDDKPTFDFIGEGKQYASSDAALSSIPHKDMHITNIEKENAEMRAKLAEGRTLDDVISAVQSSGEQSVSSTPQAQGDNTSPLDVADVVKDVLQQERAASTAQGNVDSANSFMSETFGDKAGEVAASTAKQLGLSMDGLREIAVRSPGAYKALFAQQATQDSVAQTSSGVNTQAYQGNTLTGQAKYDDMVKSNKKQFLSRDVQIAQMKEAMSNPEQYFNS
jgi:hypothetical protein